MGKHHNPYAPEFRAQMVELVKAGRSPEELAREFEPTAQTIYNWVAQSDRDSGKRHDGLTTAEREELTRLRRENRQLRLEREILSNFLSGRPPYPKGRNSEALNWARRGTWPSAFWWSTPFSNMVQGPMRTQHW